MSVKGLEEIRIKNSLNKYCRKKITHVMCTGCFGTSRLWIYFLLQTLVCAFISIWPNFGIAWATYGASDEVGSNGTDHAHTLWSWPPFGGDLLVTIIVQTTLTFVISSFLISLDLKNGPKWIFPCIQILPQKIPSKCCKVPYRWLRPYIHSDFKSGGCKGCLKGAGRTFLQVILWLILLGIPVTVITCVAYLPSNHEFTGIQLAIGKGVYGFIIACIQVPFFVWLALIPQGIEHV